MLQKSPGKQAVISYTVWHTGAMGSGSWVYPGDLSWMRVLIYWSGFCKETWA